MTARTRRSSSSSNRSTSRDQPSRDTPELESRLAALEVVVAELRRSLDVQFKRISALQAHLDHLSAKAGF